MLACVEVDVCERAEDVAGFDREVEVDEDLECLAQLRDRGFGIAEEVVEARDVVEQTGDGGAVVEPGKQRHRLFRVPAGEHPLPFALGDERCLEQRVGRLSGVGSGVGELERPVDVLPSRRPVAQSPVAAGPPVEDVGTQPVAGKP